VKATTTKKTPAKTAAPRSTPTIASRAPLMAPVRNTRREALLAAMEGRILATADLSVVYARSGEGPDKPGERPRSR
jgi:hypothetical protein